MTPEEGLERVLAFCEGRTFSGKASQYKNYYIYVLSDGYGYSIDTRNGYVDRFSPMEHKDCYGDNIKPLSVKTKSQK